MGRILAFIYGTISYILFFVAFGYAIGFVSGIMVPKSIDDGVMLPFWEAFLINAGLLGIFAVQHSIMARGWFKRKWTKIIPEAIERSTFVLITNLILFLLYWQWRPLAGDPLWSLQNETAVLALDIVFWSGWGIAVLSTFLIDHFDLFGMRQVTLYLQKKPYTAPQFQERFFYRYSRNPLMFGLLLGFWATPHMTMSRFVFALATTGYVIFGVMLEEREHELNLGEDYVKYKKRVSMIIPLPSRKSAAS